MARITVIGGSGHVGTYLVPRLVEAGHEVVTVSRGQREPYPPATPPGTGSSRSRSTARRRGATAASAPRSATLEPDIVVDMICFTLPSAAHTGRGAARAGCSTSSTAARSGSTATTLAVPTTRGPAAQRPFGDYGTQKAAIEAYLLHEARRNGFPATVFHPGHIVGPGWTPLNPGRPFQPEVFASSRAARSWRCRISAWRRSITSMPTTWRSVMARARQPQRRRRRELQRRLAAGAHPARLRRGDVRLVRPEPPTSSSCPSRPGQTQREEDRTATWEHIARSPNCSIAKARRLLGYEPRFGSLEAVQELVADMIGRGALPL